MLGGWLTVYDGKQSKPVVFFFFAQQRTFAGNNTLRNRESGLRRTRFHDLQQLNTNCFIIIIIRFPHPSSTPLIKFQIQIRLSTAPFDFLAQFQLFNCQRFAIKLYYSKLIHFSCYALVGSTFPPPLHSSGQQPTAGHILFHCLPACPPKL